MSIRPLKPTMTATHLIEYRGLTLGRRSQHYWAVWHISGWLDTGELGLAGAKRYVDFLLQCN